MRRSPQPCIGDTARVDYRVAATPIGRLLLVAGPRGLVRISFDGRWSYAELGQDWREGSTLLDDAAAQLDEYFAGTRRAFDLPLAPNGTAFQKQVWDALVQIPYGAVASYSEIAASIGLPNRARAVAQACGANPLAVAIPCHRVVKRDGALSGYRWGVERKRALLKREGVA